MLPLNLDTSRVSQLALEPQRAGAPELVRMLEAGDCALVVCFSRLIELGSTRDEMQRRAIVAFLRGVRAYFGQPVSILEQDELAVACARATGLTRRPPKAFAIDGEDWGTEGRIPGSTPADFLEQVDPSEESVAKLR
jgi:hypothetical protein